MTNSPQLVKIEMLLKFKYHAKGLWKADCVPYESHRGGVFDHALYTFDIVGVRPPDIKYIVLKYNDREARIYPVIDDNGSIPTINLEDVDRDYWGQKLREVALDAM